MSPDGSTLPEQAKRDLLEHEDHEEHEEHEGDPTCPASKRQVERRLGRRSFVPFVSFVVLVLKKGSSAHPWCVAL
jgi:hypothetical protein